MQNNRVWERACGLIRTVVEGVRFDDTATAIVVSVRPDARARSRCGRCGRQSPGYDHGAGRRRWRALDVGTTSVFIEADAPRVGCRTHGQTVVQVPWARNDVGSYPRLRLDGGLAFCPNLEECNLSTVGGGVAGGRVNHHPGQPLRRSHRPSYQIGASRNQVSISPFPLISIMPRGSRT